MVDHVNNYWDVHCRIKLMITDLFPEVLWGQLWFHLQYLVDVLYETAKENKWSFLHLVYKQRREKNSWQTSVVDGERSSLTLVSKALEWVQICLWNNQVMSCFWTHQDQCLSERSKRTPVENKWIGHAPNDCERVYLYSILHGRSRLDVRTPEQRYMEWTNPLPNLKYNNSWLWE